MGQSLLFAPSDQHLVERNIPGANALALPVAAGTLPLGQGSGLNGTPSSPMSAAHCHTLAPVTPTEAALQGSV